MTNVSKYRQTKFFKKLLVMFFRQKYKGILQCDFYPKKAKLGGLVARDKKVNIIFKPANTSFLVSSTS